MIEGVTRSPSSFSQIAYKTLLERTLKGLDFVLEETLINWNPLVKVIFPLAKSCCQ